MPQSSSVSRRGLPLAVLALVFYRLWKRWRSQPRGAPVVPGHWLLGSLLDFARTIVVKKHLDMMVSWHHKFGQTLSVKVPLSPWWIITTAPENVKHILSTNFENYPKGAFFTEKLVDLLGDGIFNVDGAGWHSQRKTASRMFTANLFKEHIWKVVQHNARKLRDVLEKSDPAKQVDVFNLMNRFTLDTIGEIGFGKSIGSLEDPSSPFLKSFDRAQQIGFQRFFFPLWPILRKLGLGFERETKDHFGRLDDYSRSVVRELQTSIQSAAGDEQTYLDSRKSFVGLFLEDANKRGDQLSEDFLRDLVLNFLIAGRDTTAQALSWALYCLCIHPDAAARVRDEVSSVCGLDGPNYDDMNRLPFLQAVIHEALRLYPSVPIDMKVTTADDKWPDGTVVPRGTIIWYNMYGMARDTAIWGSDAATFRPERWLEMEKMPDNYMYPVFNGGPRECLGRRLALVEMKTCLAMLLPVVSFKLAVPPEEVTADAQLTIGMGNGLLCYVSRASET